MSDPAPLVDVRSDGPVCVIALRREPKLNALSVALESALDAAIAGPEAHAARAVVITGGPRAFSAGADVTEMRDLDPAAIAGYYRATGGVYERIAALPVPTVAAIEGWCLGGGLELALACDFRVAGEGATFGLPEVGIGILPSSGGTHRLVRLVGAAKAKELVLLGEHVRAADAAAAGLVTRLAPAGEALDEQAGVARGLGHRVDRLPRDRDRERRLLGDAPRDRERVLDCLARRREPRDEARRGGVGGRDVLAEQDELLGLRRADEADEAVGAAAARQDADADLGEAEGRALAGDAEVAGERELEPAAEAPALDRRHRRGRRSLRRARPRARRTTR